MPEGINKTKLKSRTIYNIYFVHSKYCILPVNSHTYGNYKFQVEIGAATKIFISKLHVRYKFTVLCGDYLNWLSTGKIWHTFIYSTFEWFFTLYGWKARQQVGPIFCPMKPSWYRIEFTNSSLSVLWILIVWLREALWTRRRITWQQLP